MVPSAEAFARKSIRRFRAIFFCPHFEVHSIALTRHFPPLSFFTLAEAFARGREIIRGIQSSVDFNEYMLCAIAFTENSFRHVPHVSRRHSIDHLEYCQDWPYVAKPVDSFYPL